MEFKQAYLHNREEDVLVNRQIILCILKSLLKHMEINIHIRIEPCVKVTYKDVDRPVSLDTAVSEMGMVHSFKTCSIKRVEGCLNG